MVCVLLSKEDGKRERIYGHVLCARHRTGVSVDTLALNLDTNIRIPRRMSLKAVEPLSEALSRKRTSRIQNHGWATPTPEPFP